MAEIYLQLVVKGLGTLDVAGCLLGHSGSYEYS